jgi:hypothetical protein
MTLVVGFLESESPDLLAEGLPATFPVFLTTTVEIGGERAGFDIVVAIVAHLS